MHCIRNMHSQPIARVTTLRASRSFLMCDNEHFENLIVIHVSLKDYENATNCGEYDNIFYNTLFYFFNIAWSIVSFFCLCSATVANKRAHKIYNFERFEQLTACEFKPRLHLFDLLRFCCTICCRPTLQQTYSKSNKRSLDFSVHAVIPSWSHSVRWCDTSKRTEMRSVCKPSLRPRKANKCNLEDTMIRNVDEQLSVSEDSVVASFINRPRRH